MAAVASGKLRHKVQLQEQQITQDPVTGEMVTTWVTIAEPWAEIVPMSGREFLAAAAEQSEVRGRIVIRYREDVDASMRVVYRGKYYAIHAVLPDAESGKEHLTLMVGEGVRSAPDAPLALTGDLPDGTVDEPYSATLAASGGSPPYTLGDVLLPPGLGATLSDSTVTVAGTPSEVWEGEAHIDLSDSLGTAIRREFAVRIEAAPITYDYYVNGATGSDENDGLTPLTAKASIQAVSPLFLSSSGDKNVHVAPGTYKGGPRHQSDTFASRRKITYYMAGVTVDNLLAADAAFSSGVVNYSENLTIEVVGPCSVINVLNNSVGGGGAYTAGREAIIIGRDISVSGIGTNGDGISMHGTAIGYFYGGTVSSNIAAKSAIAHVGAGKGYHYGSVINCANPGSNIKSSGTGEGAPQAYFEDCVINATEPNTVLVSVNESGTHYGFARFTRCAFPVVGAGAWSNSGPNGTNSTIELIDCWGGGVSVELNGQSIVRGCYGDWRFLTGRGNGTGNVLVENNVFSRTGSEIFYWTAYNGTSYDGGAGGTIRNNIFIGATVAAIRSVTTAGAIDRINPLWSFQNNLFFNNTANYTTGLLPDGVDVTGQDPLLVTGAGPDQAGWLVQPGSPAIGAGTGGSTIGIGVAA